MKNLSAHLKAGIIGVLLSLILNSQTVYGQFGGGFVHDVKAYALQVQKKIDEANRWIKTITHYTDLAQKAARQVTSLSGILELAEENLSRDDETRRTFSEIGKTIRAVYQLKRELETLVQSRIAGLKNIEARMRGGIFNAEANKRDLEEYFRYRLGRTADKIEAAYERLARADAELQQWLEEIEQIEAKLPALYKEQNTTEGLLRQENKKPENKQSKEALQTYALTLQNLDKQILDLKHKHSELLGKAATRAEEYHVVLNYRRAEYREAQMGFRNNVELQKAHRDVLSKALEVLE